MKITEPTTTQEYQKYYQLRWEILRKPWKQVVGSERDTLEDQCYHAMACDEEGNVLAVCRLQLNGHEEGQIRYMAVAKNIQGKGLGAKILQHQEEKARQMGIKKIVLDAREPAVAFYEKNGYKTIAKGYLLYGEIQHYRMEKFLV